MKPTVCPFVRSLLFAAARQFPRSAAFLTSFAVLGIAFVHAESGVERATAATSPRGTFRIEEERGRGEGKAADDWITTAWIVPTIESAKRMRLGDPYDDSTGRSFYVSPDEQWIFATVHIHSQMRGAILYRRKAGLQFELVMADDMEGIYKGPEWKFPADDRPVTNGEPTGEIKASFCGVFQDFVAWSADSARLLVEKRIHERTEKSPHEDYGICTTFTTTCGLACSNIPITSAR